ncbi:myb/SANT-like DNA-binding domain-containing protein 3 [Linepithema humile]|uniref:myb/SANT-like DNA-binding domain-containing protein 3 n=1 Tax=Linepithema humile TaxID=83485 RepID=UPI00351F1CBF
MEKIEKENKSKSKHYTPAEKSLFLQILNKYKQVIECKKSNINTLREKEAAWDCICQEFNNSSLIIQERSIQQLKKLWTNLKQNQRDIITKERQARFATGGGPEKPSTEIDPDVALIAPTLMATAPVLFSSNMNDNEIEDQRQMVQNSSEDVDIEFVETFAENNKENETILCETITSVAKENFITNFITNTNKPTDTSKAAKKRKFTERETEEEVKIQRIKFIIEQEQQLAEVKLRHEERMAAIRETHLKENNTLEIRANSAKAELAELQLKKEKDRIYNPLDSK